MYYLQAVKAHPERISKQLRNRFVEMSLARAKLVLVEGSTQMDALPLLLEDIDSVLTADVESYLRNQYADFLILYADSNFANQKLYDGIGHLERAVEVAADKAQYTRKLEEVNSNLAKDNFEIAQMEFEQGKTEKDHEALVRAEFRTKLALYYDEEYPGAAELLSKIYKQNMPHYSAYEAVVTDKPDSNIYDQINKYDILLAVPELNRAGASATAIMSMYNYSYNPLRLRAKDFALVNEQGQKFPASTSSSIKKEILDQEHEVKMTLRFGGVQGSIQKLIYENGDHYTEKCFY
ncbi:MAG: hypothetical protein GF418_07655 [Chitinivibrionales bacterium]|nr:hypothetical protein [Chitinivibrionales bacterium]MBD3395488.1 hypothetical protein [Chitinivibrionales bacterium]